MKIAILFVTLKLYLNCQEGTQNWFCRFESYLCHMPVATILSSVLLSLIANVLSDALKGEMPMSSLCLTVLFLCTAIITISPIAAE